MTDFDYEVATRKRVARSAWHRKCGAKSRKCSLPSDYMTAKQKERLNGPVSSYQMNQPIEWNEFKNYPDDLKRQYLSCLSQSYNVNLSHLAAMFGVCSPTLSKYFKLHNLSDCITQNGRMCQDDIVAWQVFLSSGKENTEQWADTIQATDTTQEAETVDEYGLGALSQSESTLKEHGKPQTMCMDALSLRFSGRIDVNGICNSIRAILGDEAVGTVEIIVSLEQT